MKISGFNKKNSDIKVIVAMSGGVDSSVAAALLKEEGYNVVGITLKLYSQSNITKSKSCCAGQDIEDAIKVAKQFKFPHHVLDYQDKFFSGVIDKFVESYAYGETPIPCISCNQTVKFNDLLKYAKEHEVDALVTGHYVRRVGGQKNAKMYKAKDPSKDQSYFLFATTKEQLDFLRFPIGEYLKSEIRDIASQISLPVKNKPDIQDICFVTKDSYSYLIEKLKPESLVKGNILDIEGRIIGEHEGIDNYTIGQRKGLGLGGYKNPLYVVDINKIKNEIILGEKKFLKKTKINVKNINWIADNIDLINSIRCSARIRSTQKDSLGILNIKNQKASFEFDSEIDSTSPGQACVFYLKDQVLGGGWITK